MNDIIEKDKYIYINNDSLSVEICEDIITIFENDDTYKRKGVCGSKLNGGVNPDIKDTTDYSITHFDPNFVDIFDLLYKELNYNIKKYAELIDFDKYKHLENYDYIRGICFQMQKYNKNIGKFEYHVDESTDIDTKENRIIVYLWYLNTVDIGGETEVNNSIIKPSVGKLLLFPATWTYPHCGCKPISDNKYIITGWVVHNF